jgi:hypothetical protein
LDIHFLLGCEDVGVLSLPVLAPCENVGVLSLSDINMSGEHIYHLPGQPYYDATRIDPAYGERWFCSEEQARGRLA